MKGNRLILIGKNCLIHILKELALSLCPWSFLGQIVDTKNHILGWNRNRPAVGRLQQVIGGQQEETALCLSLHRQRQMHRHLVSIKVCIVSRTYQRVQLNCLTFYQNRLKSLDSKPVEGRGTVQHNRMLFDYILQYIPYLRLYPLYHLLRILNVVCSSILHQLFHNKGLKKLDCHLFGQTALVNLKLWSYHDNGTAGIIHTFSKQILTETAGFTLQHIGQGL